ncbi:MAG: hypothetical protein ACPGJV_06710 [Bacteriovoracaceae bacterium]
MTEKYANRVNIFFEEEIATDQEVLNSSFDYLYFLIEESEDALYTRTTYSDEYLSKLKEVGLNPQKTVKKAAAIKNWWSKPNLDRAVLKRWLSKYQLNEFKKKFEEELKNKCLSFIIANNKNDFDQFRKQYKKIVCKKEYSFSARGQRYFLESFKESDISEFPVVCEEYQGPKLNIGTRVFNNEIRDTFNIVDSKGVYRGSIFSKDVEALFEGEIFQSFHHDKKILSEKLQTELEGEEFQFDSFLYFDHEDNISFHMMHDLNLRKSMSDIGHRLLKLERFSESLQILLFVPKSLALKIESSCNIGFDSLSPKSSAFVIALLLGESFEEVVLNFRENEKLEVKLTQTERAVYHDICESLDFVLGLKRKSGL